MRFSDEPIRTAGMLVAFEFGCFTQKSRYTSRESKDEVELFGELEFTNGFI